MVAAHGMSGVSIKANTRRSWPGVFVGLAWVGVNVAKLFTASVVASSSGAAVKSWLFRQLVDGGHHFSWFCGRRVAAWDGDPSQVRGKRPPR